MACHQQSEGRPRKSGSPAASQPPVHKKLQTHTRNVEVSSYGQSNGFPTTKMKQSPNKLLLQTLTPARTKPAMTSKRPTQPVCQPAKVPGSTVAEQPLQAACEWVLHHYSTEGVTTEWLLT